MESLGRVWKLRTGLGLFILFVVMSIPLHAQPVWIPVERPDGIMASAIASSPSDVLLVTNWEGGVFRSTDGGLTWQKSLVGDFCADFGGMNQNMIKLPGDSVLLFDVSSPLFISTDFGITWTKTGIDDPVIYNDGPFFYSKNRILYIGTSYMSTDLGYTWSSIPDAPETWKVTLFQPTDSTILASDGRVLYEYNEYRTTWEIISILPASAIDFSQDSNGDIYSLCWNSLEDSTFILRSTDYGYSWTRMYNGKFLIPNCILRTSDHKLFLGDDYAIYSSSDDGESWTTVYERGLPVFHDLLELPSGEIIASAFQRGVLFSADGMNWQWRNHGLNNSPTNVITQLQDGTWLISNSTGIYHVADDFASSRMLEELATPAASIAVNPVSGAVFVSTLFNRCHRSFDNGRTWEKHIETTEQFISKYDSYGNLFLGTNSYITISKDDGIHQQSTNLMHSTGFPSFYEFNNKFYTITYLGLHEFDYQTSAFIQLTSPDTLVLDCLAHLRDGILLGGGENGTVYKSLDAGITWKHWTSFPQINYPVTELHVFPGGIIASCSGWWMFFSDDDGNTWTKCQNGMPSGVPVLSLYSTSDNYIYAGTRSGLYRTKDPVVSIEDSPLPCKHSLSPVFPNPVISGDDVHVRYSIEKGGAVTFSVYNALGYEVKRVESETAAGTYFESMPTDGLHPGVYFCCMKANGALNIQPFCVIAP